MTPSDQIDPRQITVLEPCTVGDVLSWPITSTITRLERDGDRVVFEHTKAGQWPLAPVFGEPANIEGNVCLVAKIGGQWYAAGFDWLGAGRVDKSCADAEFGADQIRVAPMDASWPGPEPGSLVGIFVTTPSSLRIGVRTINERSNIAILRWPGGVAMPVRQTSSLDPTYLRAAVRASFLGVLHREPSQSEWDYFVGKASSAETFSDGITRIGWNAYWEVRVDPLVGSADPGLGDQPARFQPANPVPEPTPDPQPDPIGFQTQVLDHLACIRTDLKAIFDELHAQRTEVVAAVKEAGAVLGKIKWPF